MYYTIEYCILCCIISMHIAKKYILYLHWNIQTVHHLHYNVKKGITKRSAVYYFLPFDNNNCFTCRTLLHVHKRTALFHFWLIARAKSILSRFYIARVCVYVQCCQTCSKTPLGSRLKHVAHRNLWIAFPSERIAVFHGGQFARRAKGKPQSDFYLHPSRAPFLFYFYDHLVRSRRIKFPA